METKKEIINKKKSELRTPLSYRAVAEEKHLRWVLRLAARARVGAGVWRFPGGNLVKCRPEARDRDTGGPM